MSRDDFYASPLGAGYSAYMERPYLSRVLGQVFWGGDTIVDVLRGPSG